jgi:hypothetical protein
MEPGDLFIVNDSPQKKNSYSSSFVSDSSFSAAEIEHDFFFLDPG